MSYSSMGLYSQVTTWNTEHQAIEAGSGWSIPQLHNRIFRNTRGTGYLWDDTFYIQSGGTSIELIYQGESKNSEDTIVSVSYTTADANYSTITYYPSQNTVDPDNIGAGYVPGYWELVGTNGQVSRFGAYKSQGNIFAIKGIQNPYAKNLDGSNAGDLLDGGKVSHSASLCEDVKINNNSTNAKSDETPDDCNYSPVEYVVHWNAWLGASGNTIGQQNIENAWNLTELESPVNGLATTFSYVCHTQQVGRKDDSNDLSTDPKYFTLGCYMYQVAGADGSLLSLDYRSELSSGLIGAVANKPDSSEVVDNHEEDYEPDAYQEQYRVLRFVGVDRYSVGNTSTDPAVHLSSTDINYQWLIYDMTSTAMTKPTVSSVNYSVVSDDKKIKTAPSVVFEYFTATDGVSVSATEDTFYNPDNGALFGGLKTITSASGGRLSLTYTKNDLGNIQNQYYQANATDTEGVSIPDQYRVPFWGNDYMVLAGNGASSADGTTVSKFAIFTFTTSGWQLSKVIESEAAAPTSGIENSAASLKRTPIADLVAISDNYFAFLSPVEKPEGQNRSLICADVFVIQRSRDSSAARAADWGEPQKLNNASSSAANQPYCVDHLDVLGINRKAEHKTYRYKRVPSLAAMGDLVAVAGSNAADGYGNNILEVWASRNGGETFSPLSTQDLGGDTGQPIAAVLSSGYAAGYAIKFRKKSLSLSQTKSSIYATILPIDTDTQTIGTALTNETQYKTYTRCCGFPNSDAYKQYQKVGFAPKKIMGGTAGGFPFVQLVGSYQFFAKRDPTGGDEVVLNSKDIANVLVWYTFDSADEFPQQTDLQAQLLLMPNDKDDLKDTFSEGGKEDMGTTAFQAPVAVSENGVLWTFFGAESVNTDTGNRSHSMFGCRFDWLNYDGSNWALTGTTLEDWQGDAEDNKFSGNSCIPGTYDKDDPKGFANNSLVTAAGSGQGIFATLGSNTEYKYWTYSPMGDKHQMTTDNTAPLHLVNAGTGYTAFYNEPKINVKQWAKDWYKAENVLNQQTNSGFNLMMTVGVMEGNIVDAGFLAWQSVSELVNSLTANAYTLKYNNASSSFFGFGRYMLDGSGLWVVTNKGELKSTNGDNLMPAGYTVDGPYFGSAYNYIALCGNDQNGNANIYFSRLKNGDIRATSAGEPTLQPITLLNNGISTEDWYVGRVTPKHVDDSNKCEKIDCIDNTGYNSFLIYQSLNNHSFLSSGGDFQLQRINSKSTINNYNDYAVATVTSHDGFNASEVTYDYAKDANGQAYASVSGLTALYSEVDVYLDAQKNSDGDIVGSDGYIKYHHYTTDPVPGTVQPEVIVDSNDQLTTAKPAQYAAQLLGRTYKFSQIKVIDNNGSLDETVVKTDTSKLLIKEQPQQDANAVNLLSRRSALVSSTRTTMDNDAIIHNDYSYNQYYQQQSSSTIRSRFNHSAKDGMPQFTVDDDVRVVKTSIPIYAWQVTDNLPSGQSYADYVTRLNRLDDVYMTMSIVKEGENISYIKQAGANLYKEITQPTGDAVYLPDESYSLVNAQAWQKSDGIDYQSWMSPTSITNGIAKNPATWLAGSTTVLRDPITLAMLEGKAPTGEISTAFSSYAQLLSSGQADNQLSSYPHRWAYASFAGVTQSDNNGDAQVSYLGFERYENVGFDDSAQAIKDKSYACSNAHFTISGRLASQNANTGNRYCLFDGAVLIDSGFSAKADSQYVLSVWVKPAVGTQCALIVNDNGGERSSTAYYTSVVADGYNWYYLEDSLASSDLSVGQSLISCTDGNGTTVAAGIDDLRLAPINSGFAAMVYDTDVASSSYLMAIASHSDRGHVARMHYDQERRAYASMVQDINQPQAAPGYQGGHIGNANTYTYAALPLEPGYSRWQGYGSAYSQACLAGESEVVNERISYDASLPNSAFSLSTKGVNSGSYIENLNSKAEISLADTDAFLVRFISSERTDGVGNTVMLSWQVNDQATINTLRIDRNEIAFNDVILNSTMVVPPKYVAIAVQGNSVAVMGDGKLLAADFSAGADSPTGEGSNIAVTVIQTGGVDGIRKLAVAPLGGTLATVFADGFGRAIENHQLSGYWDADNSKFHFTDLIFASYYDGYGRTAVTTLPVEITAPGDTTDRNFPATPAQNLLAFRGVSTDTNNQSYRNFAAINWAAGAVYTGAVPDDANTVLDSELVNYYSDTGPGRALFNNNDADANYALVSSISYNSPLARTEKMVSQPGAEFARNQDSNGGTDGDPATNNDLAILSEYQQDPLGLLSDMSQTDLSVFATFDIAMISDDHETIGVEVRLDNTLQLVDTSVIYASDSETDLHWQPVQVFLSKDAVVNTRSILEVLPQVKDWQNNVAGTTVYISNLNFNGTAINIGGDNSSSQGQLIVSEAALGDDNSNNVSTCVNPTESFVDTTHTGSDGFYKNQLVTLYTATYSTCHPDLDVMSTSETWVNNGSNFVTQDSNGVKMLLLGANPNNSNQQRLAMAAVNQSAIDTVVATVGYYGALGYGNTLSTVDWAIAKNCQGSGTFGDKGTSCQQLTIIGKPNLLPGGNLAGDNIDGYQVNNADLYWDKIIINYIPSPAADTSPLDNLAFFLQGDAAAQTIYLINGSYSLTPGASETTTLGYGESSSSRYLSGTMGEVAVYYTNESSDTDNIYDCVSVPATAGSNEECNSDVGQLNESWSNGGNNWVWLVNDASDSSYHCVGKNSDSYCPAVILGLQPKNGKTIRTVAVFGLANGVSTSSNVANAPTHSAQPDFSSSKVQQISDNTAPMLGLLSVANAATANTTLNTASAEMKDETGYENLVFKQAIQYDYSQQQYPGGNKQFGFGNSDLWGANMVNVLSWDDSGQAPGNASTQLQSLYTGHQYALNKTIGDVNAAGMTQSRQPNWYTQAASVESGNTSFTEQAFSYDLLGLWSSSQGSDAKDSHQFADKSGRIRLAVVNPQFSMPNFDAPETEQIGNYIQLDALGRTIESGRMKDVNFSAETWLSYAQSLTTDNPDGSSTSFGDILSDAYTCKIVETLYDSYQDITLYAGSQAVTDFANNNNARNKVVQTTRFNRTSYASGNDSLWSSGPLTASACNNTTNGGNSNKGQPINTISDTYAYDDLGRLISRYSNRIDGATTDAAKLFKTGFQYGNYTDTQAYADNTYYDTGNYSVVAYPDNESGAAGSNLEVKTTVDRLGRTFRTTTSSSIAEMNALTLFQQGNIQLGLTLSSQRPDPGIYSYIDYNLQGNITQLCQTQASDAELACSVNDTSVIYQEDMAYASEMMTANSASNLACSTIRGGSQYTNIQYSNQQLAYVKKSGAGYDDPNYQLAVSEECYKYDGVGRLTELARQVADSNSVYQTYRLERFAYDANGNMLQREILDYQNNCQKTDKFNGTGSNNQLQDVSYGDWQQISTDTNCMLED